MNKFAVELHYFSNHLACPPLPPIPNALLSDGPRAIGSIRSYSCEPGFQAIGNPNRECLPDSTWSPLEFACLGKTSTISTITSDAKIVRKAN